MSYPFYIHAATSLTASQHPCRLFFAAAAVAAPFILTLNNAYAALNCTTQPSCQQLGYSKSDVDGCQNHLYCPFDKNYKACIQLEEDELVKKFVGTYKPEHYLLNDKEPIAVGPLDLQAYLFEHKARTSRSYEKC